MEKIKNIIIILILINVSVYTFIKIISPCVAYFDHNFYQVTDQMNLWSGGKWIDLDKGEFIQKYPEYNHVPISAINSALRHSEFRYYGVGYKRYLLPPNIMVGANCTVCDEWHDWRDSYYFCINCK